MIRIVFWRVKVRVHAASRAKLEHGFAMRHAPERSEESLNDAAALKTDFHQSIEKLSLQAGQKDLRGVRYEVGCWNIGKLEYWVLNPSIHRSILPLFQVLLRWSEAIERNEAYEFFSAAC